MADFDRISTGETKWTPSTGVEDPDGCILPAAKLYLFSKMTQYNIKTKGGNVFILII